MKLEFSRQAVEKYSNINCKENTSRRSDAQGQTGGHYEANSHISQC